MEKLKNQIGQCKKALATSKEMLDEAHNTIVRDASIQRFEYSFETVWKMVKKYFIIIEGVQCNSPKSCFREAFTEHVLTEKQYEEALVMTDHRVYPMNLSTAIKRSFACWCVSGFLTASGNASEKNLMPFAMKQIF